MVPYNKIFLYNVQLVNLCQINEVWNSWNGNFYCFSFLVLSFHISLAESVVTAMLFIVFGKFYS